MDIIVQKVTKNWGLAMVPAGSWRRISGTRATGAVTETRPHIIPLTDCARALIRLDAFGATVNTGLTPGEVTLDGNTWVGAYRFLAEVSLYEIKKIIPKLEAQTVAVYAEQA